MAAQSAWIGGTDHWKMTLLLMFLSFFVCTPLQVSYDVHT